MKRALPLIALAILATRASAGTVYVTSGQSIQSAISSASPGDMILVYPGTYHEAINFAGKAVVIRSTAGPLLTVIDATGLGASTVKCVSNEGPATVLDGFTIRGGSGTLYGIDRLGGGMFNLQSSPTVRNCIFTANTAQAGGGMANYVASPTVLDCVFLDNETTFGQMIHGGGAMRNVSGTQIITDCIFRSNYSASNGGAINNDNSDMVVTNCTFSGNEAAGGGGAIANLQGHPMMTNCSVNQNYAGTYGGAIRNANYCDLVLENSIVWGNQCANAGYEEILDYPGAESTVSTSLIAGGWQGAGSSNLPAGSNPRFVNTLSGNLRLMPNSDAIDFGDNDLWSPGDLDLDGQPRIYNGQVDLGAYESQWWFDDEPDDDPAGDACANDTDGDGDTDVDDLLLVITAWGTSGADVNGDGWTNIDDLVEVLAADWGPCPE